MIQKIQNRMRTKDEGFTLIELMVVVLIIAILIAIAIPTFLGARGRAQDRGAQSSARNALTNAKAIYTDAEDYTNAIAGVVGPPATGLTAAEPSLTFVVGNSLKAEAPNHVSVAGQTVDVFTASVASANGNNCWHIRDAVNPAANPGTWWKLTTTAATCQAAAPVVGDVYDTTAPYAAGAWVHTPGDAVA